MQLAPKSPPDVQVQTQRIGWCAKKKKKMKKRVVCKAIVKSDTWHHRVLKMAGNDAVIPQNMRVGGGGNAGDDLITLWSCGSGRTCAARQKTNHTLDRYLLLMLTSPFTTKPEVLVDRASYSLRILV